MRTLLGISTLAVTLAAASSAQLAAQNAPTVFFGSLHSHTSLSDGQDTPAEAYAHARDVAGLDFLAITEHSHAQAAVVLPTKQGHGTPQDPPWPGYPKNRGTS